MREYQAMLYNAVTNPRVTADLITPRVLRRQTPDSRDPDSEPPVPKRKFTTSTGAEVSTQSIQTQVENIGQGTAGDALDLDMEMFQSLNDNNPAEEVVRLVYAVLTFSRVIRLSQNLTSMMISMNTRARLRLKSLLISM